MTKGLRPLNRAARAISVAVVLLLCTSAMAVAEAETETTSSTATQSTGGQQQSLRFAMNSNPVPNATGYREGNGSATIDVQGTLLAVHMQAEGMASGAHFMLILTANGTAHSVANMTTSSEGEVEAEATVTLAAGTYSVGLEVFDTSTFNGPTLIMVSNPSSVPLTVSNSGGTTYTQTEQQTQSVSTYQGGESEDDGIKTAIQTKVIPAVVDVGETGSTAYVTDGNFSVSVGRYGQTGYQISISSANPEGSRVLLVNLSSALARSLFSSPVMITLDGAQIQQSSSFTQVMGAQTGDPSRFILVNGPSGVALLISIPHFSYHTIAIVPIVAQLGSALLVDLPVLGISILAVSAVFVVAYARRLRVEP